MSTLPTPTNAIELAIKSNCSATAVSMLIGAGSIVTDDAFTAAIIREDPDIMRACIADRLCDPSDITGTQLDLLIKTDNVELVTIIAESENENDRLFENVAFTAIGTYGASKILTFMINSYEKYTDEKLTAYTLTYVSDKAVIYGHFDIIKQCINCEILTSPHVRWLLEVALKYKYQTIVDYVLGYMIAWDIPSSLKHMKVALQCNNIPQFHKLKDLYINFSKLDSEDDETITDKEITDNIKLVLELVIEYNNPGLFIDMYSTYTSDSPYIIDFSGCHKYAQVHEDQAITKLLIGFGINPDHKHVVRAVKHKYTNAHTLYALV